VLRVGLTGGIGSGKSTVARALARRGALVIDADAVAREVVQPDGPAYPALVERFGAAVLHDDGTLDRPALAAVVFADPVALADLNRITHPAIGATVLERAGTLVTGAGPGAVLVLDQPLLTPAAARAYDLDIVVVVDTPADTAVARLMEHRGFAEADARARIAAQVDREERLGFADIVVDNGSGVERLEEQVDALWSDLTSRSLAAGTGRPTERD
jgi:dephospho-CoA kinase